MANDPMIHQPIPISQITPSTIVLGGTRSASGDDGEGDNANGSHAAVVSPESATSPVVVEPPERSTSPRRDNVTIERIGREKVKVLRQEAEHMQENLGDILDRIGTVKDEYERLSSENRFLQDYIGNLMSSSDILNRPAASR